MYRPKSQQAAIEYAQKQVDDLSKRHEALSITRIQEIIDAGVSDIKKAVRLIYPLPPQKWDYQYWQRNKDRARLSIEDILHNVHYRTEQEIERSLTTSYLLSGIGLAYIADSATPMTRRSRFSITQEDIDNFLDSDFMGGNWRDRLSLAFSRWQNSVIEAIGQSAVHSDNITGTYKRIDKVFGAKNSYSLREADDIDFTTYAMGSELKSIAATLPPDIEPGTDEWKAAITAALGDKIPEYITIEPVVWDKLVQDLRASQGWDWTRTKAKYMIVEAMFSEERNRAIEEGKYDSYTQNKNLIKDMEWVAVIDDRTSEDCKRNNGKTRRYIIENYGRQSAVLPAHYNCRCAYVPRIEKWDALAGDKHYKDGNPFIQMGDFTDFLRIK